MAAPDLNQLLQWDARTGDKNSKVSFALTWSEKFLFLGCTMHRLSMCQYVHWYGSIWTKTQKWSGNADVSWRESLGGSDLLHVFPQVPDGAGDFPQGYYTPLHQFIPSSFLTGIHYIPAPVSLNILAETTKEVHGKEVRESLLAWFQYVTPEMETQEILIPASFDLCDWSQAQSPASWARLYSSGKGWPRGGRLACLDFAADKHLNLKGPRTQSCSRKWSVDVLKKKILLYIASLQGIS